MLARVLAVLSLVACARPLPPGEGTTDTTMRMRLPTGAWQREWISRHGGPRDATVTVRYVQTPSVFGDVRIPAERAALDGAASFAELGDDQLLVLARQNGFAGYTTIDGANATWHHEIDFQPAGDGADIGRLEWVAEHRMFEHALDDSYVEAWSTVSRSDDRFLAVRVSRGDRVDQVLSVAGDQFVYAHARTRALPAASSLTDAIAATRATRETIIAFLDCEISYGTIRDWRIEHSTLPWQQGKRLAFADRIAVAANGQPVPRDVAAGEAWSISVNTVPAAELRALFR
ncbi:MAG TPA: hypothetical protein VIX73_20540 [Kofleriaceae bacterium]|jgi:hypothetical protein